MVFCNILRFVVFNSKLCSLLLILHKDFFLNLALTMKSDLNSIDNEKTKLLKICKYELKREKFF